MGKKKRGKCVTKNVAGLQEKEEVVKAPHSFIIHKGLSGGHVEQLTKDFRRVMEPFTASALKERKVNTVKDFVHIAGYFHVSHLCIFSRTELGVYFKICKLPRGPSLTFKVHNFTLAKDVISSLKKQMVIESSFRHSPLLVLNSFSGEGMEMQLMASMFQNMFPKINLRDVNLNDIRRCVLMNYNPSTKVIDFRHYTITVAPVNISKAVKKIVQRKVPNLAKCHDMSEFISKAGLLSDSEAEDVNSHVVLPQDIKSRGNMKMGKSSIKLTELGPRLSLQLIKVEDGLLDGDVLYHDLIYKTEEEKAEIKRKREAKKKLKEKRKKVQDDNKKLKESKKQELKEKSLKGMKKPLETDKLLKQTANEAETEVVDDDAQYYREEVGAEPEGDLFSANQTGQKRPAKDFQRFRSKKPKMDTNKANKPHPPRTKKIGREEKTNAKNRDFRPIGGGKKTSFKKGVRKFAKT